MSDHADEVHNFIAEYAIRDLASTIVRLGELTELDDMKAILLNHYVELNMVAKHLQRIMQELQGYATAHREAWRA